MNVIAIGWGYVVLMMVLAEALGPGGSVLGAIVTLLLYGALPISLVLYVGGAKRRAAARRAAERSTAPDPRAPAPGARQSATDADPESRSRNPLRDPPP